MPACREERQTQGSPRGADARVHIQRLLCVQKRLKTVRFTRLRAPVRKHLWHQLKMRG